MDHQELKEPVNNVSLIKDELNRSNMGTSDSEKVIKHLNEELQEAQEFSKTGKLKCMELQGLLEEERRANKQQAGESAKQMKVLQGQLRQLQDELGVLREQKDSDFMSSQDELHRAREEVKTLRHALDAATADREREVAAVQSNLATVSKEMEKWRQTASKYEREINGLQGDLQQQSKQWQKAAESQAAELESIQREYTSLQREVSSLRLEKQEVLNKHQKECAALRVEKEELLRAYQKEKGNLQNESAVMCSEKEAMLKKQMVLEKDLASSLAQSAELSSSLKALEHHQGEMEKRLGALQEQHLQDNTKLQSQLDQSDGRTKDLQREYEETQTELSDLKEKFETTEQEKQSITDELGECKADLKMQREKGNKSGWIVWVPHAVAMVATMTAAVLYTRT
ncbi:sarcolemmal membrane-associated protein [Coregonus clupeaformis]|uniref:sarcolemmal membrane-associated protein n=1 Tax=Coregonus clupeaformis TaxID=59861 RepID=UPI001BE0F59E|nr:sarcolemmal membrane-associated protein [Coregonus clupeaformis]